MILFNINITTLKILRCKLIHLNSLHVILFNNDTIEKEENER